MATVESIKKPDGTPILNDREKRVIPQGSTNRITGTSPAKTSDKLANGKSTAADDKNKGLPKPKYNLKIDPNPLEKFASYTPLWTLACLEPEQFNNPPSYRNSPKDLKHVVLSSAGRYDSQRVKTAHGVPEYYINNFTMKCTVAANEKTGNSNAFKFEWDIYEPYSMGTLLQSMQLSALNAGYINYLDNAPYVLRLDFQGWDELGKEYKIVKPKFFVLKLTGIKFSVTEAGSTYKMEGVPYNHSGFADVTNTTFKDIKIIAGQKGNVIEALKTAPNSLVNILNKNEAKLKAEGKIGEVDIYDIQFPDNSSDFESVNAIPKVEKVTAKPGAPEKRVIKGTNVEIGTTFTENQISQASFGFDQKDGGNFPFKKHDDQVDEKTGLVKRDNMTIDPKNRAFQFTQGQSLTAIINQIILSSDYAKAAMDPKNLVKGFIKWWRLDVQIELLKYDTITGDFARKITYRVVPFFVHHTIFSNPSSAPLDYPEIISQIVKGYNYIYTGKNVDVLKFDIQINNLFYTGNTSSPENETAKGSNPDQQGIARNPNTTTTAATGASGPAAQAANLGRARNKRSTALINKPKGGSGTTTTEQEVAEAFHQAFVSGASADLIKVNLEILGDPYWMVDSGFANYFAKKSEKSDQMTGDGTMNYEVGDVFIFIKFQTPVDINEKTGTYAFAAGTKESPFSGIYRVVMCENQFSNGEFKQKLECLRMPGQAGDYADGNTPPVKLTPDKNTALATAFGKTEKVKTSLQEDTPNAQGIA